MPRIPEKIDPHDTYKPIYIRLPKKACRKLEGQYRNKSRRGEKVSYQTIITDLILQHL